MSENNEVVTHKVTIQQKTEMTHTRPPYPVVKFKGTCECGESTDWVGAIGLIHGWEGEHVLKGNDDIGWEVYYEQAQYPNRI